MPHFFIKHKTEYNYSDVIFESAYKVMLYPIIDATIKVIKHDIQVSFDPEIATRIDHNNNKVGTFSVVEPHKQFVIDSYLEVVTNPIKIPEIKGDKKEQWQELFSFKNDLAFFDFLDIENSEVNDELNAVVDSFKVEEHHPLSIVETLCDFVYHHFKYTKNVTNVDTTIAEAWKLRAGVCQDFTNVLIQMLKIAKIPARYVSGYICSNSDGVFGIGATHAWVEAYIPNYGWLGLDPTNNCLVNDKHVRIATGRNYDDCAPVVGIYRGNASNTLKVGVEVSYDKIKKEAPILNSEISTHFKRNSFALNQQFIQEQQQQ